MCTGLIFFQGCNELHSPKQSFSRVHSLMASFALLVFSRVVAQNSYINILDMS